MARRTSHGMHLLPQLFRRTRFSKSSLVATRGASHCCSPCHTATRSHTSLDGVLGLLGLSPEALLLRCSIFSRGPYLLRTPHADPALVMHGTVGTLTFTLHVHTGEAQLVLAPLCRCRMASSMPSSCASWAAASRSTGIRAAGTSPPAQPSSCGASLWR